MPASVIFFFYSYLCLLIFGGCGAYLIDQSGEVVEAYAEATTISTVTVEPIAANELDLVETPAEDTIIKPYNILDTKPLPHCPEGYILANKRCHKRVRKGVNAPK